MYFPEKGVIGDRLQQKSPYRTTVKRDGLPPQNMDDGELSFLIKMIEKPSYGYDCSNTNECSFRHINEKGGWLTHIRLF
jgi:hypothetical protein